MNSRHFLFLQGMQSSFFRRVGCLLEKDNCRVSRINLCLGDWIFWNKKNSYNFTGHYSEWYDYIEKFYDEKQITDIVLVGEQRKYHKEAIEAARKRDIRVIVTDFGYLRPDWIALEQDGMHGNSRLPRDINTITAMNENLPVLSLDKIYSDSEIQIIINDMVYSIATIIDFIFFPHYIRSDMRKSPMKEFFFSCIKWIKLVLFFNKKKKFINLIKSGTSPFYLFAMQLEHDFQIVAYSQYNDLTEPLRETIKSFAENCSDDISLVVKNHPCDFATKNWRKIVHSLACEYRVQDRVFFIDGGTSIDIFLKRCRGLITVNSTSGIRAIQLHCPVKALSGSIYNMNGLTYQGDLDQFWSNSHRPDAGNVDAFINVIAAKLHVRGVFFKEPGMSNGIKEFADKLSRQDIGIDYLPK